MRHHPASPRRYEPPMCFDMGGEQKSSTAPPKYVKPYIMDVLGQAQQQSQAPLEFFPGQTYVDPSQSTLAGLSNIEQMAGAGAPLTGQAQGYTGDVLSGQYLSPDSNPFFGGVADSVMSQVMPAVNQQFAAAGRSGTSPLAAEAMGRGVSRGMAPYLFGQYGQERGAMEAAANRAPGLEAAGYAPAERLLGAGAQREAIAGQPLQQELAEHQFGQTEPIQRLAQYANLVGQGSARAGGTNTSTGTPGLFDWAGLGATTASGGLS